MKKASLIAGLAAISGTAGAASPDQSERNQKNAAAVLAAYPPEALARGEQGVVGFRIALDARGRMKSCVVTARSGYPLQDRATCDLMVTTPFQRAATEGNKRGSVHNGALLWQPPTKVAVAPPRVERTRAELEADRLICERAAKTDSNARRTSVCLTAADWGRARYYARRELLRMTIEGGAG
jgi:TonB family protein